MASEISSRAEIDPRAKIGDNCKIFPFVYIEGDVEIGDNCIIFPFVSILNGTRMGSHNKVHQGSVVGALPQDFNFRGEKTECIIGNNNIIRENVVINRATHTGGQTIIGDDNVLMEGAHISHDTRVGNSCVFGYGTKIAGDCVIDNGVIFSSSVGYHLFQRRSTLCRREKQFHLWRSKYRDVQDLWYGGESAQAHRQCLSTDI